VGELTVDVRAAELNDRVGVWPLAREFATSFTPKKAAFESAYSHLLDRSDTLVLVAEADQRIVGYLLASDHLTFFANGPVCWVEEVMVASEHRRRGIGLALMHNVEGWAIERGAAYVALASRRAGDFYSALGYEESAVFYKKTVR
jgi:GNAT superfamily N-acetyltransferase